jgi:hypothetical protein
MSRGPSSRSVRATRGSDGDKPWVSSEGGGLRIVIRDAAPEWCGGGGRLGRRSAAAGAAQRGSALTVHRATHITTTALSVRKVCGECFVVSEGIPSAVCDSSEAFKRFGTVLSISYIGA